MMSVSSDVVQSQLEKTASSKPLLPSVETRRSRDQSRLSVKSKSVTKLGVESPENFANSRWPNQHPKLSGNEELVRCPQSRSV